MAIGVVADSASNIPPDLAIREGVDIVPLTLKFGEEAYLDGVELSADDFYARLPHEEARATSSAPSPGQYLEAFRRAAARGASGVVCVTVASSVSASFESAKVAAAQSPMPVEVVDSLSATMAEGFVALEAAREARRGAGLQEVAARARAVAERTDLVAAIPSLEFLARSGRVPAIVAMAGVALKIRPVFGFRHGRAERLGVVRSWSGCLEKVVAEVLSRTGRGALHVAAFHAANPSDAGYLLERVRAERRVVEEVITQFTPAMGAHTGPGLAGLAWWEE